MARVRMSGGTHRAESMDTGPACQFRALRYTAVNAHVHTCTRAVPLLAFCNVTGSVAQCKTKLFGKV